MHLSTFVPVYIVNRWILLNLTLNSQAFYQVLSALQGKKNFLHVQIRKALGFPYHWQHGSWFIQHKNYMIH